MKRHISRVRVAVAAVLGVVLIVAVTAVAAPPPGKGNGNGNGKGNGTGNGNKPAVPVTPTTAAKPAQSQYGPGGNQYGKRKVAICHKGHTIRVAQPAVKAHLKHGDRLGAC